MLPKQLRVLKVIGEVGREIGLDGRENGLDGRENNCKMGERGIGRMIVHVDVMYSSSLSPTSKGSETVDTLVGGVVIQESITDCEFEERSVREEEAGELHGVRASVQES